MHLPAPTPAQPDSLNQRRAGRAPYKALAERPVQAGADETVRRQHPQGVQRKPLPAMESGVK